MVWHVVFFKVVHLKLAPVLETGWNGIVWLVVDDRVPPKEEPHRVGQDVLSQKASAHLLESLKPRWVLSGIEILGLLDRR